MRHRPVFALRVPVARAAAAPGVTVLLNQPQMGVTGAPGLAQALPATVSGSQGTSTSEPTSPPGSWPHWVPAPRGRTKRHPPTHTGGLVYPTELSSSHICSMVPNLAPLFL